MESERYGGLRSVASTLPGNRNQQYDRQTAEGSRFPCSRHEQLLGEK